MSSRLSSHLSFDQALDDISRAYLQDVEKTIGFETAATSFVGALSEWWEGRLDVFSLAVTTFLVFAEKSAFTLPHGLNGILSLKGPLPRVHYSWNDNDQDDFIAIISPSGSRIYLLSQLYSPSSPWMFSTEGFKDDELAGLPSRLDQQTARWAIQLLHIELNLRQLEVGKRKRHMKALHRLVQKFQVLPPSLFLHDVVREGQDPVSGGGYADIFKGHLKLAKFSHKTELVCLKALRVFQMYDTKGRDKLLKEFCREAFLWTHLKHENILPCFGVSEGVLPGRFSIVSPWMSNGNIMEFLKVNPGHDRLDAIIGVARGLSYLHALEPQLVHGDIKGVNILVAEDGRCCLADFGLCLTVETHTVGGMVTTSSAKGSTRWLAPEVLEPTEEKYHNPNKAARDVYAFACTVLEIYTGKPPFVDRPSDSSVIYAVMQGKRPSRPDEMQMPWLDSVWQLMEECWLDNSHSRPHASGIVRRLEHIPIPMEHDSSVPSPQSRTSISSLAEDLAHSIRDHDEPSFTPSEDGSDMDLGKCSYCLLDIVGARFHCAICESIDICSNCEAAGLPGDLHLADGGHTSDHIMIKIPYPLERQEVLTASKRAMHLWTDRDASSVLNVVSSKGKTTSELSFARAVIGNGQRDSVDDHHMFCSSCLYPIVGIRYQCAHCISVPDSYSLCTNCEQRSYLVHDPTHIFFKIPRPVQRYIESRIPLLPKLYRTPAGPPPETAHGDDPKAYLAELVHPTALCDRCMERIHGCWFRCAYCGIDLCDACEDLDTHNDTHVFMVFKSSIDMEVLKVFAMLESPTGSPPAIPYSIYF